MFRKAEQVQGESVDTFVSRLKQLAATCDYGDVKYDYIKDQVIDNCHSNVLRKWFLRMRDLTLTALMDEARAMEAVDQQVDRMEKLNVNAIQQGKSEQKQPRREWSKI